MSNLQLLSKQYIDLLQASVQSGSIRLADGGARVADKLASLQREIHKQQQLVKSTSLPSADAVVPVSAAPPSPTHARRQSVNTGTRRETSRLSTNSQAPSRGDENAGNLVGGLRGRQAHDGHIEGLQQPSSLPLVPQQQLGPKLQQAAQTQHRPRDRQQQPGRFNAGKGSADAGQGRGMGRGRQSEGYINR